MNISLKASNLLNRFSFKPLLFQKNILTNYINNFQQNFIINNFLNFRENFITPFPKNKLDLDHEGIYKISTFRRKKTKVRRSRRKQKRKKLLRKSLKKQQKSNVK